MEVVELEDKNVSSWQLSFNEIYHIFKIFVKAYARENLSFSKCKSIVIDLEKT